MGLLKTVTLSALLASSLFARVDFKNFGNICDAAQECPNKKVEIKAIQYLLKKRFDSSIVVNGEWNKETKAYIIAFQKRKGIPATGYIGLKTKIALNELLYGKRKKEEITKKAANLQKGAQNTPKKIIKSNKELLSQKNSHSSSKTKIAKVKKASLKKSKEKANLNSYTAFIRSVDLKKSFAVYKDPKLIRIAKRAKTHLKVDVSQQRIKLVVNGKVALDAPCTTGAKRKLEPNTHTIRDKHTPYGTFRIMEKIAVKRSTIFGDIYRHGKLVYHGDRRKYRGSWKGAKFVGHPLRNWMRLTSSGIGLHASRYIKRYPASNGCIRLPQSVANTLFASIKKGTKVKVVY